jgi:hypothetical protein
LMRSGADAYFGSQLAGHSNAGSRARATAGARRRGAGRHREGRARSCCRRLL